MSGYSKLVKWVGVGEGCGFILSGCSGWEQ